MGQSSTRLYQPNLTCRYHLCETPNQILRVLTAINKDEGIGINDQQIIESLWAWTSDFLAKLRQKDIQPPKEIPTMDIILTLNHNASVYTVVVASLNPDVPLKDEFFVSALMQYCFGMAKSLGIQLEGIDGSTAGGEPQLSN